jgi:hypothetical protein
LQILSFTLTQMGNAPPFGTGLPFTLAVYTLERSADCSSSPDLMTARGSAPGTH